MTLNLDWMHRLWPSNLQTLPSRLTLYIQYVIVVTHQILHQFIWEAIIR